MNQKSRSMLTIFIGVLSAFCAFMLLGFSALMYLLESPPWICVVMGATSFFPLLIAIACLMPRQRSLAIRVIGSIVCVACLATLTMSLVAPEDMPGRPRRGMLLVVAIAGGAMAWKGKWPGNESREQPTDTPILGDSGLNPQP